jgi:hypothetical protein
MNSKKRELYCRHSGSSGIIFYSLIYGCLMLPRSSMPGQAGLEAARMTIFFEFIVLGQQGGVVSLLLILN